MRVLVLSVGLGVVGALAFVPAAEACGMRVFMPHVEEVPPPLLVARAAAMERSGETRRALRLYERVLRNAEAPRGLRSKAAFAAHRIHHAAGDWNRARELLQAATRLNVSNVEAQLALGKMLAEVEPDVALVALARAKVVGDARERKEARAWMEVAKRSQAQELSDQALAQR